MLPCRCAMHPLRAPSARVHSLSSPYQHPASLRSAGRSQRRGLRLRPQAGEEPPKEPSPDSTPGEPSTSGRPATTTTGSDPKLPLVSPAADNSDALQIPKAVIDRLKFTVFGFDTFWVTSVENYQANGVIFKGNVRGKDPAASYQKLRERAKAELGDKYELFLLTDGEGKPTVVVLPVGAGLEEGIPRVTEVWLATLFAVATVVTTMNANGLPLLEWVVSPTRITFTQEDVENALPGALALFFLLGAHEWGHYQAAGRRGVSLYLPFVLPAGFGFIGSFGAITRVKGLLPNREALLDVYLSGPLIGSIASAAVLFLGLVITAAGGGDTLIDTPAYADSLVMALLAQLFFPEALTQPEMAVSPLLVAGWAGLVVNALNLIPVGELDGAKISLAIWDRQTSGLLSVLTLLALIISAFSSSLSFAWVLLVLFLQRGPIAPCLEELSEPKADKDSNVWLGAALLALPLLVLLPYPVELITALDQMKDPTLLF